jgi:pimeloyl-ACP methyl ester carboxylesterase
MLGDADLRPHQGAMRMPAAVIVGEEDYAAPVAMSRQMQQAMPDATLSILPGVRHLTPIECPDVIADEILRLLQRASLTSPRVRGEVGG